MEQKKGISITKLIFSLLLVAICVFVFYTIYTKVKEKKPNVVNSNNNNASVEKKEFTKLEATKLFERIISDPAPSYSYPTKKGELLLDDMTLEQKLAIVFSNIDSNKLNKVCSTDLEDELLQNGFLSSKSVEGSECFNYYASVDDILATSKLIFGPNYTLDIENNTEKVVPYYYFENKDIVVFKYSNTTYQEFGKLISFKNDDMFAILNIELNYPAGEGYDQDHYRVKFKSNNGSYYFYSIEKL